MTDVQPTLPPKTVNITLEHVCQMGLGGQAIGFVRWQGPVGMEPQDRQIDTSAVRCSACGLPYRRKHVV